MTRATDDRYAPRERKAEKILAILQDYLGQNLRQKICLDVGCSTGSISNALAAHFKMLLGVEIDAGTLERAQAGQIANAFFVLADGECMPVLENSVDVVICAQVYEHALGVPALAAEIWRVLRPGGICFFSGPNKYAVMEEHYWLPFLSWLPQSWADLYMRLGKRGQVYDIAPKSYWHLRRVWRPFVVRDYAPRLIEAPEQFGLTLEMKRYAALKALPKFCLEGLRPFIPNFNWILVKPQ